MLPVSKRHPFVEIGENKVNEFSKFPLEPIRKGLWKVEMVCISVVIDKK